MFTLSLAATTFISALMASSPVGANLTYVENAFRQGGIVPNVIPSFSPTAFLAMQFPASGSNSAASVNNPASELTLNQTSVQPTFYITAEDGNVPDQSFVLIGVDPDAPSRQDPSSAQYRHLLASGMRADSNTVSQGGKIALVNTTSAISPYVAPAPPAGSGLHRYTFLLYNEPDNFLTNVNQDLDSDNRTHWNVSAFAEQLGLGSPIAGTFFSVSGPNSTDGSGTSTGGGSDPTGSASGGSNGNGNSGVKAVINSGWVGLVLGVVVVICAF